MVIIDGQKYGKEKKPINLNKKMMPKLTEMEPFQQDLFEQQYFNVAKRGGYLNYSWDKHQGAQRVKLNWIKNLYQKFELRSILFAACAHGFELRVAQELGYLVAGCEMSDYAISQADKSIKDLIKKADLRNLSIYKDNEFDLVCCFDAIHIVYPESRHLAFKELNRVAEKGLVIGTRVRHDDLDKPGYDGTYDGVKSFRETITSVIKKVESLGKFKLLKLEVSARFQAWLAFGDEKYFGATYDMQRRHEQRGI